MSKKITFTILSMSLLTVMAGAAVAPALGIIGEHFSGVSPLLIKLIVSLPAVFIVVMNLAFGMLCRWFRSRTLAIGGLLLYVVSGVGAYFADNIWLMLVLRALLGVSVGVVMPLSVGLLAYYHSPEKLGHMMGFAAAMNQLGGIVATMLAGYLAVFEWRNAFLVYLLGLVAIVLVVVYLPNDRLPVAKRRPGCREMLRYHSLVVAMFMVMLCFFVFITSFAILGRERFSTMQVTVVMVGVDVVAFLVGVLFGSMLHRVSALMKYVSPLCFLVGFTLLVCDTEFAIYLGCVFLGVANGCGVPYLNTIAGMRGGKNAIVSVMPLVSAALYLGQFFSPLVVSACVDVFLPGDKGGAYKIGMLVAFLFLLQVFFTRGFQGVPRKGK